MQNLWNDQEAAQHPGLLGQRVYTSRLLGREPSLVLHGGGNTSVKATERNLFGEEERILYVKGSGWDLATIEAPGFTPLRLAHVLKLATLERLSDVEMARQLRVAQTNPSSPSPSVESILHAVLPFTFVDHTHADALLALTNTPSGLKHVQAAYGDSIVVVPYVMPGFDLARACAEAYPAQATARTIGMVLMNHGLFTWGETAKEAYDRMIALVTRAEHYLAERNAWHIPEPVVEGPLPAFDRREVARLRREVSDAAGFPLVLETHHDAEALSFARRSDVATVAQQGPATPDHVIRTKQLPQLDRDVADFVDSYKAYFAHHSAQASQPLTMLDPAPRLILDPELGLVTIGRTAKDARIAEDLYRHTMEIVRRATALEDYRALPAQDIFNVEYWDLEQAKLRQPGALPPFTGEVALITGAASGIGKACAAAFQARGAAVIGLDLAPDVADTFKGPGFLGLRCDVSDEAAVLAALDEGVRHFGGLDLLVLNAGLFGRSAAIAELPLAEWDALLRVNLDANLVLLREAHPLLACAPRGGRVVVIGSKNVPAPGPGAVAYSASKAALTQLARVAALEWGADGIRVNVIHPNAVFDTAIWTDEVLQSRAARYGKTVAEYKRDNVLRTEVTSRDVAELAAEMCGPAFARTTGAQVPVDGGNERVI